MFYASSGTDSLEAKVPVLFGRLVWFKAAPDRFYDWYVAKVQQRFAMVLNFIDQIFVAGLPRALGEVVGWLGCGARALHVGSIHGYVYWFLFGVALCWAVATGLL